VELCGDVHGSGYSGGAALVRRADGQMVQLGPLMYALLECVDGRRARSELAECLSERLGRRVDEEHVVRIAQKLAAQGLLAGHEHKAPPRRNPLLALRWKVLITNPRTTQRLTVLFTPLFRPFVLWPVVAAFVGVLWFVLFQKGLASATADAFNRPGLLLLIFCLSVASAGFHELGHAAACRYGGATPGGMGAGIYLVWPAFYTDVTDAYRLPRRDRLRVDLGGLYFNAIVSVLTMGAWLLWRVDALLLLIALQLLMMVKNLSPVIRSDGYHILADATGVPDLYAHIGPTIRRLVPGRPAEPSALTGRARLLVTLWVLIVVPVLLSLLLGAVLLLPRLVATAWDSGRLIASALPADVEHGHVLALGASLLRLAALLLPLIGSVVVTQKIARSVALKAHGWSEARPARRAVVVGATALACCGAAWAWAPAGQYEAVHAADNGTLTALGSLVTSPVSAVRPNAAAQPARLAPGTYLAVSMIPVGGATKAHPALFVVRGEHGHPATALLVASTASSRSGSSAGGAATTTAATTTAETTTDATTTTATTTTTAAGGDSGSDSASPPVAATSFPFALPAKPGPGDTQALAVNTQDGGVKYDIAYSLVTVTGGKPVTNTNSAFALASCKACTTVAVSFQVVLIVGQSNLIAPIDAAVAANANCPACLTTAIADQIVVTVTKLPSKQLLAELTASLKKLNALRLLGKNGTPAAVAAQVLAVQQQIDQELSDSGLLANKPTTTTTSTTTTATTTTATTTAATTTTATTTTPTTTAASPQTTTTTKPATTTETTTTATTTTTAETTTTPTTTAEATTTETTTATTTTTPETTSTTTTGG
jgi:putative peptide zinc metalloprotease protein